jgi:hypothetical protein
MSPYLSSSNLPDVLSAIKDFVAREVSGLGDGNGNGNGGSTENPVPLSRKLKAIERLDAGSMVNVYWDNTEKAYVARRANVLYEDRFATGFVREAAAVNEEVEVFFSGEFTPTSASPPYFAPSFSLGWGQRVYLSANGHVDEFKKTEALAMGFVFRQLVGYRTGENTWLFVPGEALLL